MLTPKATIKDLLGSVDKLGYIVACINGTGQNYVIGSRSTVNLNEQSNYICLMSLSEDIDASPEKANYVKQRGNASLELRKGGRITGSTIFRAIGLGTLKEQQQHYEQVYQGKESPVSAELQELFDYGTSQEINALDTLVGKIMPVCFPDLMYRENGCEVVELGDSYAVISEDGNGVGDNAHVQKALRLNVPDQEKSGQLTSTTKYQRTTLHNYLVRWQQRRVANFVT